VCVFPKNKPLIVSDRFSAGVAECPTENTKNQMEPQEIEALRTFFLLLDQWGRNEANHEH
jgi:hypothetical protein